jgi:ubiquinone/menaquinone biosynthesis C-methylase UbiE
VSAGRAPTQFQKPRGLVGRWILQKMNVHHSPLTDWGLAHVPVEKHYTILDVGCGGGRTVSKLAVAALEGKVCGIDFSETSVAASKRTNARQIARGSIEIRQASVSQLPFADTTFDLITAVETHFWWHDLPAGMREIFRVLKPGGKLIIIAEVYKGATSKVAKDTDGIKLLSLDGHRELFADAGYSDIQVIEDRAKGWMCALGARP